MPDVSLRFHKDMLVVAPLLTLEALDANMDGSEPLEYFNILDEELVREAHERYKLAGAQCVLTNTRRAHCSALRVFGLEDAFEDINIKGVSLAREAGFEHVIGVLEPVAKEVLLEQAAILAAQNPDALMLLGEANEPELAELIAELRALTSLPLIALSQEADVISIMGFSLQESLDDLQQKKRTSVQPFMVCPRPPTPEQIRKTHRLPHKLELAWLIDEMTEFALEARHLGAQFIGTAPGSPPVFTGAISAAISSLDVLG